MMYIIPFRANLLKEIYDRISNNKYYLENAEIYRIHDYNFIIKNNFVTTYLYYYPYYGIIKLIDPQTNIDVINLEFDFSINNQIITDKEYILQEIPIDLLSKNELFIVKLLFDDYNKIKYEVENMIDNKYQLNKLLLLACRLKDCTLLKKILLHNNIIINNQSLASKAFNIIIENKKINHGKVLLHYGYIPSISEIMLCQYYNMHELIANKYLN